MKDSKYLSRSKPWRLLCGSRNLKGHSIYSGLMCKDVCVIIAALFTVIVLLNPGGLTNRGATQRSSSNADTSNSRKALIWGSGSLQLIRSPDKLGPKIVKLDSRRKSWWKANSEYRKGRPKVLLVTGSESTPCQHSIETHMLLKAAKNKINFARMHDFQMHFSLLEPVGALNGSRWAKLAVLRMLIVAHPEVEWFWWMDGTAVVTDMNFEIPLEKYRNHDVVIFGDDRRVYDLKDWEGLLTGNFLIRNSQWSIEFLDAWGGMGMASNRNQNGEFLSQFLSGRPRGTDADDQSGLVYLLATERKSFGQKVFLEKDIPLSASWNDLYSNVGSIDGRSTDAESFRLAAATLFTDCFRCFGGLNPDSYVWELRWEQCRHAMDEALDFADNQIYRQFGYELPELGVPRLEPIPGFVIKDIDPSLSLRSEKDYHSFPIPKLPGPVVEDWDVQRERWFLKNPSVKKANELGHPKTMIVTGSSIEECPQSKGAHFVLQSLKNKVDYARFHDMQMFYGMVDLERTMGLWWTKIPAIRVLMLANPDVEWFWWCDGDAVITDMVFDAPFETMKDYNLILYGETDLVYEKHNWVGLNTGIYLIRNCQWTLDLFDIWASMGTEESRTRSGKLLEDVLVDRPVMDGDDQGALMYIIINDLEERWVPKVRLETRISLSGDWKLASARFEGMKVNSKPGTGTIDWPWITHFAGCQPCGSVEAVVEADRCNKQISRAHDFADDQVLNLYGLEHAGLGNPNVQSLKFESGAVSR